MEYWDNKGQVYNDKQEVLNPLQKAYNKALAVGTNAWDWANETNPESDAYKQKKALVEVIETLATRGALKNQTIPKFTMPTGKMVDSFFTNSKIEESPDLYTGDRTYQAVIDYIGNNGIIKTPTDKAVMNDRNLWHYLFQNNPERLKDLGKVKRAFEKPDLVIKGQRDGKDYRYYAKPFKHNGEIKGHLNITRDKTNGNYYQTNFNLRGNKLADLINNGQVIYNNLPSSTAPIFKNMPVNNIIQYLSKFFNP